MPSPLVVALALLVVTQGACSSSRRSIRIPKDVVASPDEAEPDRPAEAPYVIKMSDGQRTWQIEIPAGAGAPAFEAAIPLGIQPLAEGPVLPATEADAEIVESKRTRGEAVPGATADRDERPPSYLRTLARVRELYARRQHEVALVELVRLERGFPDDVRILEMKGTLLARLGRVEEARAAWERVLALDPDNAVVLRALEALGDRGG